MAHFNFVISQNAKWGHAGFYIDCHQMTKSKYAYRKIFFYKKSTGHHDTSLHTEHKRTGKFPKIAQSRLNSCLKCSRANKLDKTQKIQ